MLPADIFYFLSSIPDPLAVMIVAMIPLAEAQASIPLGLFLHLSWQETLAYTWLGGVFISFILLHALGPVAGWLARQSDLCRRFFDWLFTRTRHRFVGKYEKYGLLALWLFVVLPGPGSGAWASSLAAFLFGMPKLRSLASIAVGLLIADFIIIAIATGIVQVFSWLA